MAGHSNDGEFGFQIAPMLDILFVLLLFFMVSSGAQKHEAQLVTQLPGPAGPGPKVQVSLEISPEGQVLLNGAPTDTPGDPQLPTTTSRLKAVIADTPDRPVVISPSPSTRHQSVVDVLNACKAAGVKNVAFASLAE